jgi:DNA adenine methylase
MLCRAGRAFFRRRNRRVVPVRQGLYPSPGKARPEKTSQGVGQRFGRAAVICGMTKPILRWPGGKHRHLKILLPLIRPHACYIEAFAGGLALFLAKERSALEVINDQNDTLVALYRNAQWHAEELIAEIQWALNARRNFVDFRREQGLTEIQRCARWLICNRISYGGKGENFGLQGARSSRENLMLAIRALRERLDRTIIENLPYEKCVLHYDKPDSFFFFDPPYLRAKPGVYDGWTVEQMRGLRKVIDGLKGSFVLTVDDSPETREIFAGLKIKASAVRNTLAANSAEKQTMMKELFITPREAK